MMLTISNILGELIAEYFHAAERGNMDCRLIVPGLTHLIASEIHEYLRAHDIRSYQVVDEDHAPDEKKGWLRPNGLTSERIGSFVVVVSPGQLAHIQDSVRGSGGTSRSLAFSEEWPWIDNGCEAFKFHGPVLNRLIAQWAHDKNEKEWLKGFIRLALVKETMTYTSRASLLLEEMLGSFDPLKNPELKDVRKKILFHVGIPCPSISVPPINELIKSMTELCVGIVDRCKKEVDIRDQAHSMIPEIVEDEAEREKIAESLDIMLDGMGSSQTTALGHLALHSCWGRGRPDLANWQRLTVDRLRKLFEIRVLPPATVYYDLESTRGIISRDKKSVVTFVGEVLTINVSFSNLPPAELNLYPWRIVLWNRTRRLLEEPISSIEGTALLYLDIGSNLGNYSRRIPLKLTIRAGDITRCEVKFSLHVCGEDRPSFIFIEPGFETVDATLHENDASADKNIEVEEPVRIYLVDHVDEDVSIQNADAEQIEIARTEHSGIWSSNQRIDPSTVPKSQIVYFCQFGAKAAIVSFEATDIEKGEFTLEDELRTQLIRRREDRVGSLTNIFLGESKYPYPYLGKIIPAARRRITFASLMTSRIGWRPILANLWNPSYAKGSSMGDYIYFYENVEVGGFGNLSFPEDAVRLLRSYSEARDAVQKKISANISSGGLRLEHPLYASHPIFVTSEIEEIQALLITYLKAYSEILAYLEKAQNSLEWSQLFVLTYLDCVVHWEEGPLKNSFFLVGPWHPLVLAKRFMVQSCLVTRAQEFLSKKKVRLFVQLIALLEGVQGFRWLPAVSADDRQLVPAYVSSTSDPGWHLAFKTSFVAKDEKGKLADLREVIRTNFGLDANIAFQGTNDLAASCLSSYRQAFPSRRAIGIRVCHGYSADVMVQHVDSFLHAKDSLEGTQLPGGVNLFLEEGLAHDVEFQQDAPPIGIYQYRNDDDCFREENPDIYLISSDQSVSFRTSQDKYVLPRGQGLESVFFEPLAWLTEGQSQLPKSITYDYDIGEGAINPTGLGDFFLCSLQKVGKLFSNPTSLVQTVELPPHLRSPWAISPGGSIDPAVFVKYVRDGMARSLEERALWDYRIDVSSRQNSFYILSKIPKGFSVAVNGLFNNENLAATFIEELGRLGIAIGGEALRSGRHAMGVVGLVGAVRILQNDRSGSIGPLRNDEKHVSFLVPVDSFSTLFGYGGSKRTDILAIQVIFPDSLDEKLKIYACGVESKYVSNTFSHNMAVDALGQAKTTSDQFGSLVETSLMPGGIPERQGLLSILKFGLRITSPSSLQSIPAWVEAERRIFEAVLRGRYEYSKAKFDSVLVTTEIGFPGVAVAAEIAGGIWIRLNKINWPGIAESPSLELARKRLAIIFGGIEPPAISVSSSKEKADKPAAEPSGGHEALEAATPEKPRSQPAADEMKKEAETRDRGEVPDGRLERIFLGVDEDRIPLYYDAQSPIDPLDNLNMMVTGSPGTGKTQLLKYLICELREQRKNVLILDFKNDFAIDLIFTERAKLNRVFATIDGLPFNPLIPFPIINPRTGALMVQLPMHIAGVASVLKETCDLGPQQQVSLKNAISSSFKSLGFSVEGYDNFSEGMHFPDFSNVGEILSQENIGAYNRLSPLFTLGLFKEEHRNRPFHSLINDSVILDFSLIPSNQIKNALAQLVVLSAHNYYNSQPQSGALRQVLVLDEAHRVLKMEFMPSFVRECRAYGVSTILSSQYPSDFSADVSAAMATKILHSNGRDVNRVKAIVQMLGCEGREEEASSLDRFQAFIGNRHYPHTIMRTMNYPLFLIWTYLKKTGRATKDELSKIRGLDTSKLPLDNLVRQLENFGYAEERGGFVHLFEQDAQA